MLNDLSTMKAAKKSGWFMAALCLFFAALFLLLLPGGVARAEEETVLQDEAAPLTEAVQLDDESLTTSAIPAEFYIGSTDVSAGGYWTTDNAGTMTEVIETDPWNVAYNKDSKTLTLRNATIMGSNNSGPWNFSIVGIRCTLPIDLTIDVEGTNAITCKGSLPISVGIITSQKLTLTGTGSLNIVTEAEINNFGITEMETDNNGLEMNGPDVTVTSGSAGKISAGVWMPGDVTMTRGSLEALGGDVEATSPTNMSTGISCINLNVNGGTIAAMAGTAPNSYGIHSKEAITVNGGTIGAESGQAAKESKGIWVEEAFKMTDGSIYTISNAATVHSYGLEVGQEETAEVPVSSTEISGGRITAISDNRSSEDSTAQTSSASNIDTSNCLSAGIFAYGPFTMTDGDVNATAMGKASTGFGFFLNPLSQGCELNMSGGTLTAASDGSYDASVGIDFFKTEDYYGNLNLSGGSITATGSPAKVYSNGVNNDSDKGIINVSGGSLTATADQANDASIGVGFEKINITGGSVIAKSAAATKSLALQTEPDVSGYDAYHWRVAEGDAFANKPLVYQETTYFEIQPGALAEAAAVTNPSTGLDAQSNLLMMGAGLCLTAVILWVGYSLYKKSQF